ncbi:MAG TPA: ABC transporter substrate-binding protein [Ktedonobacterales bacterium]
MANTRTHRTLLAFLLLSLLGMLLASCAAPSSSGSSSGNVITAGVLSPLTGNGAPSGKDMVNGWNLYFKLNGDKVCNGQYTVKTIVADTAGLPDTAVSKARATVEQNGAQFIEGPLFANEGYAVASYTESKHIPLFPSVSSSDDLTQRQANPYVLRIAGWSSSLPSHPFGQWLLKNHPEYKNIVTIGEDYAFGYENVGGFVDTFTAGGGHIVKQLWTPLNTADYSPYFAQIKSLKPDAVYSLMVGGDAPRFMKAYSDYGLKGSIPLIGGEVTTDQSLLRNMGPEAQGVITAGHFAESRDDKATQDFVSAWKQAYNQYPSYYAAATYTAAQWVVKALNQVNCKVSGSDVQGFLNAIKSTKLENTPFGPMSLDSYGNPIENVYIREVKTNSEGKQWNAVIDTIPSVSQFGSVDPATYLKQPVYSKSFQGNSYHP